MRMQLRSWAGRIESAGNGQAAYKHYIAENPRAGMALQGLPAHLAQDDRVHGLQMARVCQQRQVDALLCTQQNIDEFT